MDVLAECQGWEGIAKMPKPRRPRGLRCVQHLKPLSRTNSRGETRLTGSGTRPQPTRRGAEQPDFRETKDSIRPVWAENIRLVQGKGCGRSDDFPKIGSGGSETSQRLERNGAGPRVREACATRSEPDSGRITAMRKLSRKTECTITSVCRDYLGLLGPSSVG
jgi:hypothetical protein